MMNDQPEMLGTLTASCINTLIGFLHEANKNPNIQHADVIKLADKYTGDLLQIIVNHPNQHVLELYKRNLSER